MGVADVVLGAENWKNGDDNSIMSIIKDTIIKVQYTLVTLLSIETYIQWELLVWYWVLNIGR